MIGFVAIVTAASIVSVAIVYFAIVLPSAPFAPEQKYAMLPSGEASTSLLAYSFESPVLKVYANLKCLSRPRVDLSATITNASIAPS